MLLQSVLDKQWKYGTLLIANELQLQIAAGQKEKRIQLQVCICKASANLMMHRLDKLNQKLCRGEVKMDIFLDVLADTLIDALKILPFLFLTYMAMEYIEHKMGEKSRKLVKASGKFGPLLGGILGIFPQCGFSAAAANLYAGRVISLGTLIAIFLSTSDEMLPIFISEQVDPVIIFKILGMKLLIGVAAGFLIDAFVRNHNGKTDNAGEEMQIEDLCIQDHCHCENGIIKSAWKHTLQIFAFIFVISFLLNGVVAVIGEDRLSALILNRPFIGPLLSGVVGLIPNCAASVVITQLYLEGLMSTGAMLAGLLVGAGVGVLILFKENLHLKENIKIVLLLYTIGAVAGIIIECIGIQI